MAFRARDRAVIPNGTKVRLVNQHSEHVAGSEGEVVWFYIWGAPGCVRRHYIVCINGLDYDLTREEIETT